MSRTHKDRVQNNWRAHPDEPYWKYRWWLKHGSSTTRRAYNRRDRHRDKLRVRAGKDPVPWRRYLPWIWW
jgi:hypothetical protein